ncbi:MAG TPA: TIGR04282 family arsenosugar biosynthesis glycosyltransferase [Actinomycetota bacterium]|nr:TIGR04282 family arsenosugar biosynthesis glycosyltransferase [Actinomycetota bacterium]
MTVENGAVSIIIMAKAPIPGQVKSRLCPPCTPEEAALLAEAALHDTLETAGAVPGTRTVVSLDGRAGAWLPRGILVMPQRGEGLAERLAAAFHDVGGPAIAIGMDTPQVPQALLARAVSMLERTDAVLGPADDGGYWAIGLRRADARVFQGIPMSTPTTAALQQARLEELGLRCGPLPIIRDVDTFPDAVAVAAEAPGSRFAEAVRLLGTRV